MVGEVVEVERDAGDVSFADVVKVIIDFGSVNWVCGAYKIKDEVGFAVAS